MLQIDKELKKIFTEEIVFNDAKKHLQSFVKSTDNLVLIYDDIGEKELDTLGGLGDCFVDKATGTVYSKLGNFILWRV